MGDTLGDRLHTYRKLVGLTLKEVAHFTRISLSFLSDIEHGRTNPSVGTLKRLASFYKVSIDTLLAVHAVVDPPAHSTDSMVSPFELVCTDYELTLARGDY